MGWRPKSQTPGKLVCEPPPPGRIKKPSYPNDATARTQRDLLSQRSLQFHAYPARIEYVACFLACRDLLHHQPIRVQPDVLVIGGVPGIVQQRPTQTRDLQPGKRQHKPRALPRKERSDHERENDDREVEPAEDGEHHHPAHPVKAVDTTAAGDTFIGGLAAGLCEGLSLHAAIALGQRASALCVTRHGAQPSIPWRRELA